MLAVVSGMIATYPLGGVAWDYGQYLLGLQRLGFTVLYLEDSGKEAYDPDAQTYGSDASYGAAFLGRALDTLATDAPISWHYRSPDGHRYGIDERDARRLVADADLLLNVSGSLLLRPEWSTARRSILLDTDPGLNHYVNYPRWDSGLGDPGAASFRSHDAFFTYAQAIGTEGCRLPDFGLRWHPTVPPVIGDAWETDGPGAIWTTVMTWDNFRRPIEGDGILYGTKERELMDIEDLPRRLDARLQIAVDGDGVPRAHFRRHGWSIVSSTPVSRSMGSYRDYVQSSRGEFSVAKNIYVATGSGWFSCRSVCYLASGRPVVLQDTGYSAFVPTGEGLLAWRDLDGAAAAIERIEADYASHAEAARRLAADHFGAERVIGDMLYRAGVN